jgi:hypothetical protein
MKLIGAFKMSLNAPKTEVLVRNYDIYFPLIFPHILY